MLSRLLISTLLTSLLFAPSWAATARDLRPRMMLDGYTTDFAADERIFSYNTELEENQEPNNDSPWGVNNDLNQIRITWDARYLYLAGEGKIWGNNMILFIDSTPGLGLGAMDSLNSWRRNFSFDTTGSSLGNGFAPDLFGATWDGNNTGPHLILQEAGQRVRDFQISDGFHSGAATFSQDNFGRSMELAIPWKTVFLGPVGYGTRDTVLSTGGLTDTVSILPRGARLKIIGVVTAGADGTGGPDSAPDNTRGHTSESGDPVYIDNWATIELDHNDDTGLGDGGPDGVADWGVDPVTRVGFRFAPPVDPVSLRFTIKELRLDRPAFRPDYGERIQFSTVLDPAPDPSNEFHQIGTLRFTANIYDLRGRFIRNLYVNVNRPVLNPTDVSADVWDGRDQQGRPVAAGAYVLRTVIEPNISRFTRSFVVVR